MFEFSNFSKDSKLFDDTNKKVIGKMKDKFGGFIVIEFVGLKSKMRFMKKIDGKECNKAKWENIAAEFDKSKDIKKKRLKRLWWLKKNLIIEKNCADWKRLW